MNERASERAHVWRRDARCSTRDGGRLLETRARGGRRVRARREREERAIDTTRRASPRLTSRRLRSRHQSGSRSAWPRGSSALGRALTRPPLATVRVAARVDGFKRRSLRRSTTAKSKRAAVARAVDGAITQPLRSTTTSNTTTGTRRSEAAESRLVAACDRRHVTICDSDLESRARSDFRRPADCSARVCGGGRPAGRLTVARAYCFCAHRRLRTTSTTTSARR